MLTSSRRRWITGANICGLIWPNGGPPGEPASRPETDLIQFDLRSEVEQLKRIAVYRAV
jgi:hypothetical protein